MWRSPVVKEVHEVRSQLSEEFGGDLGKYIDHVKALTVDKARADVAKRRTGSKALTKKPGKGGPKPPRAAAAKKATSAKPARKPRSRRAA